MKLSRKRVWIWGGVALLGFTLVAFLIFMFGVPKYRSSNTVAARYGDLIEAVYGLGTVTAAQTYQLKIGVIETMREVYVKEGDQVRKGAPLVRLDLAVFRAPFPGTVTSLPFKPGENVYPQLPIVTLVNLRDRYISVSLEQEGALRVRSGQTARLSIETIRGRTFTGQVRTLFPSESQFIVHIDVPDLPPEVIPGMTGDVAIEVARRQNVLLIPVQAVQSGRVLVKKRTAPKKVQVQIGAIDGRWAEVIDGDIKAGDKVLVPKRE